MKWLADKIWAMETKLREWDARLSAHIARLDSEIAENKRNREIRKRRL